MMIRVEPCDERLFSSPIYFYKPGRELSRKIRMKINKSENGLGGSRVRPSILGWAAGANREEEEEEAAAAAAANRMGISMCHNKMDLGLTAIYCWEMQIGRQRSPIQKHGETHDKLGGKLGRKFEKEVRLSGIHQIGTSLTHVPLQDQ
ncbi:hypothetical protein DAPPUDRAFT_233089 [Daphnia pulex]|uniref:Uncharacterized protein n=1 Tax=Daphnia pulex TaxID=6669 RepID=E9FT59_DAPPU|nr:hypothetical protein DAPPUDRAFT_233089 [Daphnia pulex]|eukprot:EFX89705.1 hypothetical protein DAPPUDRAFT_233089 [Daphnia pulex]